jgi:hypothetical protein
VEEQRTKYCESGFMPDQPVFIPLKKLRTFDNENFFQVQGFLHAGALILTVVKCAFNSERLSMSQRQYIDYF